MTHQLNVLDRNGDTKLIWDPDNEAEVAAARAMFDTLTKKGYQAFSVKGKGEKGELVREFDPELEKIIMSPRIVGG